LPSTWHDNRCMTRATSTPEVGTTVNAGGIATNVHLLGDITEDPVLLIHGSGPGVTAYANWRLTMPALAEDFGVIAPDVLGFGATERPEGISYDMKTWTRHLVDLLDALDISRAHVVGNSFGSSLAMSLAINHPGRVNRLVLMGSVGVPFDITPGLEAVWGYEPSIEAMNDLLQLFAHDASLVGPDLAELRYQASIAPGVRESFALMFPPPRQQALDLISHALDDIRAIQHPTLVVHGREDRIIPMQNALDLLDLIEHSQLHVFGRCGHWTQIEYADEFNRLVADFLASSRTQPGR
jgi:2-hydroxymuconate-semialdehyde hydrolase